MVLGKLLVPGRPTIWITVGQGPTALAVGAGGVVWTFYSRQSFLSSFSLSLEAGLIETETLSQRAVKPNTTNQQPNTGPSPTRKKWSGQVSPSAEGTRGERSRSLSLARARVYVSVCKGVVDCVGWVSSFESFFQIR